MSNGRNIQNPMHHNPLNISSVSAGFLTSANTLFIHESCIIVQNWNSSAASIDLMQYENSETRSENLQIINLSKIFSGKWIYVKKIIHQYIFH